MSESATVRRDAHDVTPGKSNVARVVASSLVGTTLEFYEFFIYGTMAALVFGELFFPSDNPVAGTLAAFATFGVGFLARPLGSALFGHFGDRIGRKATLVTSLTIMGIATTAIGLLPIQSQVGWIAPALLVLMRLLQGLALGGEWGGAALMLVEYAKPNRKGVMGSLVMIGAPAGLVLASIVVSASLMVSGDSFNVWGWRLPFLLSALLLVVALFIRLSVAETPEFAEAKRKSDLIPKAPIGEVFKRHWFDLLLAFGIAAPGNAVFFLIATYTINYATVGLGMDRTAILLAQGAAAVVYCFTIPLIGLLCDKIGAWKVQLVGAVAAGIFIPTYFAMIDTKDAFVVFIAMTLGLAGVHALLQSPQAALFSARFPVQVRYTGISLSQAIPTTLIGGTISFIATWLVSLTGNTTLVVTYVVVLAVLGVVCSIGYRRPSRNMRATTSKN